MNDASKQLQRRKPIDPEHKVAALSEEVRAAREQAQLVEQLALRVLDECRVSLMLSFRYLDIALWKLPFVARQQKAALSTDGTNLFFNPDLVVLRFRASSNELIRDYLHVILHCVLRHPYETYRRETEAWSVACDICVEAIAMEMCEHLYPCAEDEDRADGLRILKRNVDALTPARVYRALVDASRTPRLNDIGLKTDGNAIRMFNPELSPSSQKGTAWQLQDALPFLEAVERMRPLFWRDDHDPWNLLKMDDEYESDFLRNALQDGSDDANGEGLPDDQQQTDEGVGQENENAEGAQSGESDSGDTSSDGHSEAECDAESSGDSDGDGNGELGESDDVSPNNADEGDASRDSAQEGKGNAQGEDAQSSKSLSSATMPASAAATEATVESDSEGIDETDSDEAEGSVAGFAPVFGDGERADIYGYIEKDLQEIVDLARLSQIEWTDISKRIEADLKTMSSLRGYEAGTLMANLALVNRSRIDYADFLRRFSTAVEDANMSDDEFDYIYYMYGLNRYGNMPLVEPLESRETFRIRDFVIALDTSGSTTGELERLFVTRTLELLEQSAHRGEQVNIHIVQCDSKIRKVTVITDIHQLDDFEESFEVYGMGGTDFRPVFTYIDDLLQQGYFGNLRGLLYFTDGMGVFPASPPPYDTAFVFLDDEGKETKVPPWAMRVVLDEDMIREW